MKQIYRQEQKQDSPVSAEQGDGAVDEQKRHDCIGNLSVFRKKDGEYRSEQSPADIEEAADRGQKDGERDQGRPVSFVVRKNITFHGNNPVDKNLRVHEFKHEAVQKSHRRTFLLDDCRAAEGFPGKIEHVAGSQHKHGRPDFRDQGGKRGGKERADDHDDGKSAPDSDVEGIGLFQSDPACVAHGHNIVRPGGHRG